MTIKLLYNTPLWVCAKAIRKCLSSEDKSNTAFEAIRCPACGEWYDDNEDECRVSCGSSNYYSEPLTGDKDKELIERVGNKNKHKSALEHLVYTFDIDRISRACLQELARHRTASLSVGSTRYTLKELKNIDEPLISQITKEQYEESDGQGPLLVEFYGKYYHINDNTTNEDIMQQVVGEECIVMTDEPKVNIASLLALENLRLLIKEGISNDTIKYMLPESYKTSLVWTINARSLQNFLSLRTSKSALWEIRDLANELFNQLPEEHKYLFKDFIYKEPVNT